jgi:heterodisulfide reductase subunit D
MANQDYSVRQLMEMSACTGCRYCTDVCPAVSASEDGELSALYRMKGLNRILRSRNPILKKIFRIKGPSDQERQKFSDTVFKCTLCGNCQEVCPVGIHLKDLWVSLRADLVKSKTYPKKIEMIPSNLMESHNVFGEDNEERAEWVEDLRDPPEHGFIKERADVVYFTGCVASYFPMAQKIPMALAKILEVSGVDFTLLGEEEWCCGYPLLGAGYSEQLPDIIEHNMEAVRQKGAQTLVFACPTCYQMWNDHYPKEFNLMPAAEFLLELVNKGDLNFNELDLTVTYHDPCDLGRGSGIYDVPRELIRSIPGIKFVEMKRNRENCMCCGGGGNLEMVDPKLVAEIAKQKIEQVTDTGADAVVTACQQCVRTMMGYVRRNKLSIDVMDITLLVEKALL